MNNRDTINEAHSHLVLSVFSGLDLLGKGFKNKGFIVVSAGDIMLGQDIREFRGIKNRFDGIIGGSPCQDFSKARRTAPTGYGLEMVNEFTRVVKECSPEWFLLENVPQVPDIEIEGYYVQRFCLSPHHLGHEQHRPRHFQFGSRKGLILDIKTNTYKGKLQPCLTATEGKRQNRRTYEDFLQLQGLDSNFKIEGFTQTHKYKLIGNGVHLGVASEIARLIKNAIHPDYTLTTTNTRVCICGCGKVMTGKATMYDSTCRKRMQKRRRESPGFIHA